MSNNTRPSAVRLRPGELDISGHALIGPAMQMTARLRDHIERLDNGVVYAVDDLAVVLRAMLCPGRGNDVLRRLYDVAGCPRPDVLLSRPPTSGPDVVFSVGAIPTRELGAVGDGATHVRLTKWPGTRFLVVTSAGRQMDYTWAEFLNGYANKWGGAHLDSAVPSHLQLIDYHAAGGLSLTGYLLRAAAVEVWYLAQAAFVKKLRGGPQALTDSQLEGARYSAPGGISTDPKDISHRGQLHWFSHTKSSAGLLWYVDETSDNNDLRLSLGSVPYDVHCSATDPETEKRIEKRVATIQEPRYRSPATLKREELKTVNLSPEIRTLAEVRSGANA